MKTLNSIMRTILLALALVSTTNTSFAYDFMVNGIYYNINDEEATVTYHDYSKIQVTGSSGYYWYENHYNYYAGYSGQVIIPETVSYNDKIYSVTKIGEHAFEECSGLTSVIIPNTIIAVENYAFNSCFSLRSITSMALTPPTCPSFYNYGPTLYVPFESLEMYKSASAWGLFFDIIGFGQNTLSMADYTTLYGDTIVIPVTMENVDDITAFQTDLYLPQGFELLKDGDDYMVSLSSRKGRDHVIMTNDAPDGSIRVLSYSPTLKKFSGNDGELFYITVKVPTEGDSIVTYPIWLRKTLLTTTDEQEIGALETLGNLKVYFYILGDVDHSGAITVADIVMTAKYILYQNPDPFVFEAADMNGDGKITITDVVKIANLILDQDYEEPTTLRSEGSNSVSDRMSGEAIGNTVSINLDNEVAYTALQMDLTLPEGMTASDFALANRASSLSFNVKDKGNGKVRVIAFSPNLKVIKGNNGAVLTFNVDGTMGDIIVDRIEVVNLDGEAVRLGAFAIPVSDPTTLNETTAYKTIANIKYFNLAGQQISEPATGATLVVTTYTDSTCTTSKVIR